MTISVPQAQLFFLALTRIMAIIIHVPVLGGQTIPNQVRIGLGFVLAMVIIPWQPLPADVEVIGLIAYTIAIFKEIIIGTLVGFAADLAFGAIQLAGSAMGLGSGFASSRIFNPVLNDSGSSFEQIFIMTASLLFLVINGHHLVIIAIQKTFETLPLNSALPLGGLDTLISAFAIFIVAGIQIALPVMAAVLLTDLTLGLLARIAPQVQVYFLGLPIKVTVAMLSLVLLFSVIAPSLRGLFKEMTENMLLFIQ